MDDAEELVAASEIEFESLAKTVERAFELAGTALRRTSSLRHGFAVASTSSSSSGC
jgi:hypothetical protein